MRRLACTSNNAGAHNDVQVEEMLAGRGIRADVSGGGGAQGATSEATVQDARAEALTGEDV